MAESNEKESKLFAIKQKLAILEWDVKRDQINPAKRVTYDRLKEECVKLEAELTSTN